MHQKSDIDYCLIRRIETSTAKLHDSQVDLSTEGEVVLRDRGYFGVQAKGNDFTMKCRTTEKPLVELDKEAGSRKLDFWRTKIAWTFEKNFWEVSK